MKQHKESVYLECKELFSLIIGGDFNKLKQKGWLARQGTPEIKIEVPILWSHEDSNIAFNLHAWRFMSAVWAEYIRNPTPIEAKKCVIFNLEIIKDWYINHEKFKSKFSWYDMGVGIRALHLAFMLNLIEKYNINIQEIKILKQISKEHINWLSNIKNLSDGNHGLYQLIGLRTLEYILKSNKNEEFCVEQINNLLDKAFDENYVNTENSPFYHKYNLEIISKISLTIFPSLYDKINKILMNGNIITKWLTAPNGEFYRIGDTEGRGTPLTTNEINEENKKNINNVNCIFNDLHSSGYQIIRSNIDEKEINSFALVFHGTNKQNVHRHCDNLSFIYFHQGIEVFADPGKYTYENNKLKSWFISDISHNTAGMDSFPIKSTPLGFTKLNEIYFENNFFHLSGTLKKTEDFTHERSINFKPNELIEINDNIKNLSKLDTELRFLFGNDIYLKHTEKNIVNVHFKEDNFLICSIELDHFKKIKIIKDEDQLAFISKTYGQKQPVYQLLIEYPNSLMKIKTKIHLKNRIEYYRSKFKLNVNGKIVNNKAIVEIQTNQNIQNFDYAFYLYVDNIKYFTQWYKAENNHEFLLDENILNKPLKVRGFIRLKNKKDIIISTNIIKIN